jgi:hypothetical protein
MPRWKITAEFQPRSMPSLFGRLVNKQGDPRPYTVHAGDLIDGANVGDWIKTHIDGVSPRRGLYPDPGPRRTRRAVVAGTDRFGRA